MCGRAIEHYAAMALMKRSHIEIAALFLALRFLLAKFLLLEGTPHHCQRLAAETVNIGDPCGITDAHRHPLRQLPHQ